MLASLPFLLGTWLEYYSRLFREIERPCSEIWEVSKFHCGLRSLNLSVIMILV